MTSFRERKTTVQEIMDLPAVAGDNIILMHSALPPQLNECRLYIHITLEPREDETYRQCLDRTYANILFVPEVYVWKK
jgi:hypothetical protein